MYIGHFDAFHDVFSVTLMHKPFQDFFPYVFRDIFWVAFRVVLPRRHIRKIFHVALRIAFHMEYSLKTSDVLIFTRTHITGWCIRQRVAACHTLFVISTLTLCCNTKSISFYKWRSAWSKTTRCKAVLTSMMLITSTSQIQRTEASDHIYFSQRFFINVKAIFSA